MSYGIITVRKSYLDVNFCSVELTRDDDLNCYWFMNPITSRKSIYSPRWFSPNIKSHIIEDCICDLYDEDVNKLQVFSTLDEAWEKIQYWERKQQEFLNLSELEQEIYERQIPKKYYSLCKKIYENDPDTLFSYYKGECCYQTRDNGAWYSVEDNSIVRPAIDSDDFKYKCSNCGKVMTAKELRETGKTTTRYYKQENKLLCKRYCEECAKEK